MKIKYKFCSKSNRYYSSYLALIIVFLILNSQTGCRKFVEVNTPITSTSESVVFSSDATASAVLTGIYSNLNQLSINSIDAGPGSLSLFAGLSADEFKLYSGISGLYLFHYTNSLTSAVLGSGYWESIYRRIYITNSAIDGINKASTLTTEVKKQLLGEAKFMRAFFYFYLVNLYGDIPLVLTTDYSVNAVMPRTPRSQVWDQIVSDLKDAQVLLSSNFLKADAQSSTNDRLRPTKWAALGMLSRTYLYLGKWSDAEMAASAVISNNLLFDTVSLNSNVFIKNSKEAIWQLQPVNTGWNTEDARVFIIPPSGPSFAYPIYLSNYLLNSFESGDYRKIAWVKNVKLSNGDIYYYPYKYTSATLNAPVTEYQMVLRIAEMYLIRAEARVQQGDFVGALADLNVIRKRAMLSNYSGPMDLSSLLSAILHERQVELFTEWGHRWFDLKRSNTVDSVMSIVASQKGGTWNTNWQWYPISQSELQKNPFLVQNEGY